jgi:hypothetical protein
MEGRYDFSGWATKNDLRCSDGRTIRRDAFKENDGKTVPLIWNHQHDSPEDVLGHALLVNKPEGVYAYGVFNKTEAGMTAKNLVDNGDVVGLSIYANQLKQRGSDVVHGMIREVSLVLAGANPGASIDSVIRHSDGTETVLEDSGFIYTGEGIELYHVDEPEKKQEDKQMADNAEKDSENKTVGDVFDTLNEEQKKAVYYAIAEALDDGADGQDEEDQNDEDEEDTIVKHNVFDQEEEVRGQVLSHSDMEVIFKDGKRLGSLKESVLAHAQDYGIENIGTLFPEPKALTNTPEFIKRDAGWVDDVMNGVHRSPFSRIKSVFADLREDEARALGYLKGNLKKEEVFSLLKRTTAPTTIYKKQKLDRDDVVDITDFDVVAWIRAEMRVMLNEEIARAALIGDGRLSSSDDKIDENCIRPIWTENELFAVKRTINFATGATDDTKAKAFIREIIKSRKDYKGSGNPTLFTTEDMLTNCLLLEDTTGRLIYTGEDQLRTALRVKKIVTVPVMENLTRNDNGTTKTLQGIVVNLTDYTIGADKGGAVNAFDDFDIDYNQMKYLIETRCSGALTKPFSAIVVESTAA